MAGVRNIGDLISSLTDALNAQYNEAVDQVRAEFGVGAGKRLSLVDRGYYLDALKDRLSEERDLSLKELKGIKESHELTDDEYKKLVLQIYNIFGADGNINIPEATRSAESIQRSKKVIEDNEKLNALESDITELQDYLNNTSSIDDKTRELYQEELDQKIIDFIKLRSTIDSKPDFLVDTDLGKDYTEEKIKKHYDPGVGGERIFHNEDGSEDIVPVNHIQYGDYVDGVRQIKHDSFARDKDTIQKLIDAGVDPDNIDMTGTNTYKGMGGALQRARDVERLTAMNKVVAELAPKHLKIFEANKDKFAELLEGNKVKQVKDFIGKIPDMDKAQQDFFFKLVEKYKVDKKLAEQAKYNSRDFVDNYKAGNDVYLSQQNPYKVASAVVPYIEEQIENIGQRLTSGSVTEDEIVEDTKQLKKLQADLAFYTSKVTDNKFKSRRSGFNESWKKVEALPINSYPDGFDSINGMNEVMRQDGSVWRKRISRGTIGGADDKQHTMLIAEVGYYDSETGTFNTLTSSDGALLRAVFHPTESWLKENGGAVAFEDGTEMNQRNAILAWIHAPFEPNFAIDIADNNIDKIAAIPFDQVKLSARDIYDEDRVLGLRGKMFDTFEALDKGSIDPKYGLPWELRKELSPETALALKGVLSDGDSNLNLRDKTLNVYDVINEDSIDDMDDLSPETVQALKGVLSGNIAKSDAGLVNNSALNKDNKSDYDFDKDIGRGIGTSTSKAYEDYINSDEYKKYLKKYGAKNIDTVDESPVKPVQQKRRMIAKSEKLKNKFLEQLGPSKYEIANQAMYENSRKSFLSSGLPEKYMQGAIADGADREAVDKVFKNYEGHSFDEFKGELDKINPKVIKKHNVKDLFRELMTLDRKESTGYIDSQDKYNEEAVEKYNEIFNTKLSVEDGVKAISDLLNDKSYKDMLLDAQITEEENWNEVTHQDRNTWDKDFTPDDVRNGTVKDDSKDAEQKRLKKIDKKYSKASTRRQEYASNKAPAQTEDEAIADNLTSRQSATEAIAKGADKIASKKNTKSNKNKQSTTRRAANNAQRNTANYNVDVSDEEENAARQGMYNSVTKLRKHESVKQPIDKAKAIADYISKHPEALTNPDLLSDFMKTYDTADLADGKKDESVNVEKLEDKKEDKTEGSATIRKLEDKDDDSVNIGKLADAVDDKVGTK